ncbi:MAG: right-handed parallel beta-helix repeat-containing protein [Candidatus Eisenbacteria bacterium]|nr:right-handed parallel beta-helix repeat-containing protein [Candidatus Eisenbacteria bacterium]
MRYLPFVLLFVFLPAGSNAATIHVPEDQPSIQAGIGAAGAGDTVLVACGTYLEHDIAMKSGVVLRSETGEAGCVTIDAQAMGRVIFCNQVDALAAIEGFQLTGGSAAGHDPGSQGGAVALLNSSPRIRACAIVENDGPSCGGGIYAYRSSSLIENCVFARNTAIDGAGIYLNLASPRILGCTFHDNDCMVWGGAVYCQGPCSPELSHCTLARNDAYQGGGLWCVVDCHIRVENSLICFSTDGEGIYAYDNPGHPCEVVVRCCDVYGNAGANYGGTLPDQTGIEGNISADPLFCDMAGDDFRLDAISPCLPGHNQCNVLIGALGVGCPAATVPEVDGPEPFALVHIGSPFQVETTIDFATAQAAAVNLEVFDLAGRRVRTLAWERVYAAGRHGVRWDGRDEEGGALASGVYICRFSCASVRQSRPVVLIR